MVGFLRGPFEQGASYSINDEVNDSNRKFRCNNAISNAQLRPSADIANANWVEISATRVPIGGSTGQVLSKVSGDNYDVQWSDIRNITGGFFAGSDTEITAVGNPASEDLFHYVQKSGDKAKIQWSRMVQSSVMDIAVSNTHSARMVAGMFDSSSVPLITSLANDDMMILSDVGESNNQDGNKPVSKFTISSLASKLAGIINVSVTRVNKTPGNPPASQTRVVFTAQELIDNHELFFVSLSGTDNAADSIPVTISTAVLRVKSFVELRTSGQNRTSWNHEDRSLTSDSDFQDVSLLKYSLSFS